MAEVQELLKTALTHHQTGELDQAEEIYQGLLDNDPRQWEARYYLGTLQLQRGQLDRSVTSFLQVIQLNPDLPDVHNNLGVAYHATGKLEEAEQSFEQALRLNPHYERAFFNLGSLYESRGMLAEAMRCFRKSYEQSGSPETYEKLADVLKVSRRFSEAEVIYRELLQKSPGDFNLSMKLAYVLVLQRHYPEAVQLYEAMLDSHPGHYQILVSLSYVHECMGNIDAAIQTAEQSIEAAPEQPEGYNNLGNALRLALRLDEASTYFEKALARQADFPIAEFNLATTRMLQGDLQAGWQGYERRSDIDVASRMTYPGPAWQGEPLEGKTICLWCEQGFGDTLLFIRFASELKRRGAGRVLVLSQVELAGLLRSIEEIEVLVPGDPIVECDYQCSLMSVPRFLETSLETIPAEVPLFQPAEDRLAYWKEVLSQLEGKKVGLNWSGNLQFPRDQFRSVPLKSMLPLSDVAGVQLVSVQQVNGLDQLAALENDWNLWQPGSEYQAKTGDFGEAAALIGSLDLLITADTSYAHLAGGLGVPVWVLVSRLPEWRWLLERTDSPWYPTARLFRQTQLGDWDSVTQDVKAAMEQQFSSEAV
ncbi:tetratricopeptide repeat protein [Gimesia panareensis]|uniref:Photosystem I assembly protein Ycf3 n=1 Tax=Gimesia panareensis TaxID=2527978 RepID=A0A518A0L3_9PLAN|nr:tetratricopeptide repeat protein [Gimesia panareensis]QDT25312.1 photosystem I assembly protein Ycf3 [Gimesia panareensis]QDU48268.1 photosystem I assembly protein Ycf3 [Gimesia panareensis]